MTKKLEDDQRIRKAYAGRGQRSQKHMSFLIDNENVNWLQAQANKSRYINLLIAADREKQRA